MRKVHVGDEVWKYKIGKQFVVMRGPDNRKLLAPNHQVGRKKLVWSWRELEYVERLEIKPSHVKAHIERHARRAE
jgi:hypothetical protein